MIRRLSTRLHHTEDGAIFVLSLIIVFALTLIGISLMQMIAAQYSGSKQQLNVENAITAAEAGVSATITQLNKNTSFTGFSAEQNLYSSTQRGKATYTVSVTSGSNNTKILIAVGKTYRSATDTIAANTKKIKVTAALQPEKVTNSLIFGSGGVYLSQGAGFPQGDIYIRGQLQMEQNSFIGTSTQAATLSLANVGCDTGGATSNWPQPCGASSPPIKMVNATPGTIYGTVCATNQTSTTGISPTSGLQAGCSPKVSAAPTFNKQAFIQSVSATGTAPSNYQCDWSNNTRTIPANTRISGDLNLSAFFGTCTIYIAGNVYISGSLIIGPGAVLRVADAVGTVRPTIVVNQGASFTANAGNNDIFIPNASGTPMFVMVFGSTNSTCSASETVPSATIQTCLSSAEAKSSAVLSPTGGSCSVTVNATGAIFYGYYGSLSFSPCVTARFYGLGAQGGWFGASTQLITTGTDAPFANVLSFPLYRIVDYQQVY